MKGLLLALVPLIPLARAPSEPRIEYFELTAPDGAGGRQIVGAMRWIRSEGDGGARLEWEIVFPEERLRVLAVEDGSTGGPRLVWRELAPGAGRSLLVEGSRDREGLRIEEWARGGGQATRCGLERGAVLPLHLLEFLREGDLSTGPVVVFDPLSRRLDTWTVRSAYRLGGEGRYEHLVELRRADGTLAGRYRFEGGRVVGFAWQHGGIEGRPTAPSTFEHARDACIRPAASEAVPDRDRWEGGGTMGRASAAATTGTGPRR